MKRTSPISRKCWTKKPGRRLSCLLSASKQLTDWWTLKAVEVCTMELTGRVSGSVIASLPSEHLLSWFLQVQVWHVVLWLFVSLLLIQFLTNMFQGKQALICLSFSTLVICWCLSLCHLRSTTEPSTSAPSGAHLQAITVGGQKYQIVASAAGLIQHLDEYLSFHIAFPSFAAETGQRIVEVLSFFNSRSCQLLLGAQAMRMSGLKSITAKHLALCSQCISLLTALHSPLATVLLVSEVESRRAILHPDLDRLKQVWPVWMLVALLWREFRRVGDGYPHCVQVNDGGSINYKSPLQVSITNTNTCKDLILMFFHCDCYVESGVSFRCLLNMADWLL